MTARIRKEISNYQVGCSFLDSYSIIPIVFFLCLITLNQMLYPYEINADEGINLVKAYLIGQDYSFMKEIWSDQPPFFTLVLSVWYSVFENTIEAGRILVVSFSCLLLFSFYRLLRRSCSIPVSLLTSFILIGHILFAKYATLILIGLPSIALSLFALDILTSSSRLKPITYLGLSAAVLAFSIQTKFFTAPLVIWILIYLYKYSKEKFYRSALIYIGILISIILIISFKYNLFYTDQLISTHTKAKTLSAPSFFIQLSYIFNTIGIPLFFFYFYGLFSGIRTIKVNPIVVLPIGWSITNLIIMMNHNPLWEHHLLLILIPVLWTFSLAMENLKQLLIIRYKSIELEKVFLVIFAFQIGYCFYMYQGFQPDLTKKKIQDELVHQIQSHSSSGNKWLLTDRVIFAFLAKQMLPPELACFSRKRVVTGSITAKDIENIMLKYNPQNILLGRFNFYKKSSYFVEMIKSKYRPVYKEQGESYPGKKTVLYTKDLN